MVSKPSGTASNLRADSTGTTDTRHVFEQEHTVSASDEVFILGINMTKFGKHFDKDIVDLGAEAMMAALTMPKTRRQKTLCRLSAR